MKFPTDKRCVEAMDLWRKVELEHAAIRANEMIKYEIYISPEMTPIEQIVFFALKQSGIDGVEPQKVIGKYRVDFFIKQASHQIIIECDGHNFHEKTKEQAQKDKERDRNLQALGFKVYHFTGSEIWKTMGQCVFDVVDITDY